MASDGIMEGMEPSHVKFLKEEIALINEQTNILSHIELRFLSLSDFLLSMDH